MKEVLKNDFIFYCPDDLSQKSIDFYTQRYAKWEQASFNLYNHVSDKEKIFVDIGGWNACTAIYAAKLSKHVVSFESDPESVVDFKKMMVVNSSDKITLVGQPVYKEATSVRFSPRKKEWNTSSSRIQLDQGDSGVIQKSIAFCDIEDYVKKNGFDKMDENSVSLIKIDIEGGEEHLLESLNDMRTGVPLYISMHLEWWTDPEKIFAYENLLSQYKFIYVTSSFGVAGNDYSFQQISIADVCRHIYTHRFVSVFLTNTEYENLVMTKNTFMELSQALRLQGAEHMEKMEELQESVHAIKGELQRQHMEELQESVHAIKGELQRQHNELIKKEEIIDEKKNALANYERTIALHKNTVKSQQLLIEKKNREIKKVRQSKSFRIGNLFFRSLQSPKKILTFPYNILKILKEKKKNKKDTQISEPLISIIVTAFNVEQYIERCLQSLIDQTYENIEIIVYDDCSTDNTSHIIKKIAKQDHRIKIIEGVVNRGTYWAKNYAIMFAKGEYVATQDADDFSHEEKIFLQWESLQNDPVKRVSFCNYVRVDDRGSWISNRGEIERVALMGAMYHRDIFRDLGYFDSVRFAADSEMIERIEKKSPESVAHMKKPLYYAYIREDSLTMNSSRIDFTKKEQGVYGDTSFLSKDRKAYVLNYREVHKKSDSFIPVCFPPKSNIYKASQKAIKGISYKRKTVGTLATYPGRKEELKKTISTICDQVDHLYVYLNNYKEIPTFLKKKNITAILSSKAEGDLRDNGKFYCINYAIHAEYLFTFDDDIIYPEDYVDKLIAKMQFYGDSVAVGVHGVVIPESPEKYFSEERIVKSFRLKEAQDSYVNLLGTGTLAVPSELVKNLSLKEFPETGMADIWFALFCQKKKIPMICVERSDEWLRPLDVTESLYEEFSENDSMQTRIIKKGIPWKVYSL